MSRAKLRPDNRAPDMLRPVAMQLGVAKHAEGSCLISCGDTKVLCTASLEESVPPWLRKQGLGWVTAEYGMLPRATNTRTRREATAGKQSGRTQEIQRLIGRSLRAVIDRKVLGERQISIDCDVLQADGGTRTASITGAWLALWQCCEALRAKGVIDSSPLRDNVAAVSVGLKEGVALLDLSYAEDSTADADANFVFTGTGQIIEVQATGETAPFQEAQFQAMLKLAQLGTNALVKEQQLVCKE